MDQRELKIGDSVVYVDPVGERRPAVVTAVWKNEFVGIPTSTGCNLVFVSNDETRTDIYGRQIERETSVVHKSELRTRS